MYLEILGYIENKSQRLNDLREIFFLTAKKDLKSEADREALFNQYAAPYIENWPDDVFFACDLKTKRTMGYLIGCRNSKKAEDILGSRLGSYDVFADLYAKYPAHLHMNVHPDFQGHGVGSFLLQEYIIELKKYRVRGVHIVTAPSERNVDFYLKHKLRFQVERSYNNHPMLFMGLAL